MSQTPIASQRPLRRESVNPHKLMRSIAKKIKPTVQDRGLSLNLMMDHELKVNIITDPTLFRQIVIELINYFTEKLCYGEISVVLDCSICKPTNLFLMIYGTQWLIPNEELAHLFSEENNPLFKAKQLVEQLGGMITAENGIDDATLFVITFPVQYLLADDFLQTLSNAIH